MSVEQYYLGVISALTAGSIWSLSPGLISRLGRGYPSKAINAARSLWGVLFLVFIIPLTGSSYIIDYNGVIVVYVSAVFGPLLGDLLYIKAIKRIGGGNAVSIGYFYIFFAQLFSAIAYGEVITIRLIIGTFTAIYGIHLVYSGEKTSYTKTGFIYAIGAALSWGLGATLSKAALQYGDPISIAFYRNLSVVITLLPFTVRNLAKLLTQRNGLLIGVITGGFGFGVGMTLFLYAITIVGVSVTALATSLTPVLGRIFARIIASEKPSRKAVLGTIVTALGIAVGLTK